MARGFCGHFRLQSLVIEPAIFEMNPGIAGHWHVVSALVDWGLCVIFRGRMQSTI